MRIAIKNIGLWIAIGFNLFLLAEYWWNPAQSKSVVLLFWLQSIIAGVECLFKIFFAKSSAENDSFGGPTTVIQKVFISFFFIIHFGIFVLFLGAFAVFNSSIEGDLTFARWVWPSILILMIASVIELPSKVKRSRIKGISPFLLMFQPYVKLIPLAAIVLGSSAIQQGWVFPLFIFLKTAADVFYAGVVDGDWTGRVSPSASV